MLHVIAWLSSKTMTYLLHELGGSLLFMFIDCIVTLLFLFAVGETIKERIEKRRKV
jgi:hypothetical protein